MNFSKIEEIDYMFRRDRDPPSVAWRKSAETKDHSIEISDKSFRRKSHMRLCDMMHAGLC